MNVTSLRLVIWPTVGALHLFTVRRRDPVRLALDLVRTSSIFGNVVLYTGREFDPETGLHYYRAHITAKTWGRSSVETQLAITVGSITTNIVVATQ